MEQYTATAARKSHWSKQHSTELTDLSLAERDIMHTKRLETEMIIPPLSKWQGEDVKCVAEIGGVVDILWSLSTCLMEMRYESRGQHANSWHA